MGHFDMICPSLLYVSPPSSSKHACTCPHSHMHTHSQTYTQIYERPSSTQWFVCRSEQAGTPGSLTHTEWHFVLFLNLLYNQDCLFTRRVCVCVLLLFVCLSAQWWCLDAKSDLFTLSVFILLCCHSHLLPEQLVCLSESEMSPGVGGRHSPSANPGKLCVVLCDNVAQKPACLCGNFPCWKS